MPGQHPEGSVEDCISSVLADNPELDEESAARICNAQLKADLTDEQVGLLTELAPTLDDDAWTAVLQRLADNDEVLTPLQRATAATGYDIVGIRPDAPLQKQDTATLEDPPDEVEQALEADEFYIYGKASIQQYDVEDVRISVKALEDALDRFFDSKDAPGIISRGHTDVPVGMPVLEHTLDSDTTLVIDGETYHFEAGETLRTEAKEADGDGRPELWLLSRLANDTDIARETRLQALAGELNGYSVTVKPKSGAEQYTEDGRDVLAVDLHAVTVGSDEQIKNKGSEFDVAEYKALLNARADDAVSPERGRVEDLVLDIIPMANKDESADGEEDQGFMARILPRSANDSDDSDEQTTEQKSEGGDGGGDGDAMDDAEQAADPIDAALENGVISAGQAGVFREVAQKNSDAVATLLDAVDEDEMEADRAKQLAQDLYGDGTDEAADDMDDEDEDDGVEEMADADDDDVDAEQKQAIDEQEIAERVLDVIPDGAGVTVADIMDALQGIEMDADTDKDAPGELKSALEAAASRDDERLEAIETKLDELAENAVTDSDLEQKLEAVGEALDEELDDLIQRADRVQTPSPATGGTDESGPTARESLGLSGGD